MNGIFFNRFLATGRTYSDLAFSFRVGISTVSCIVKNTVDVIWVKLHTIHMPIPTKQDFTQIS